MQTLKMSASLVALGAVTVTAPGAARAQASGRRAPGLEVNTLRPAAGPHAIVQIEGSRTLEAGRPTAMALFNYASLPIAAEQARGEPIVDQQLAWHLAAALGVGGFAEVGVSLPFYFASTGFWDGAAFEGPTLGDAELRAKFSFLSPSADALGLGALVVGRLPSGRRSAFTGAGAASAEARLIADKSWDRVLVSANLGVDLRPERDLLGTELGYAATLGAGAEFDVVPDLLRAHAEAWTSSALTGSFGAARATPIDLLAGIKIATPAGVTIGTAAGAGVGDGFGAPEFRATVSLRWTRTDAASIEAPEATLDGDEDGLIGDEDLCPDAPEDFDGVEDEDGCPDPDDGARGGP